MSSLLRAYNSQTSVECAGFAKTRAGVLVYLDAVGFKTSCKSIWATVSDARRAPFAISGNGSVVGGDPKLFKYIQFWTELPEQNAHNLIIASASLFEADPLGDKPFHLIAFADEMESVTIDDAEVAVVRRDRTVSRYDAVRGSWADTPTLVDPKTGAGLHVYDPHYSHAVDIPEHWEYLRNQRRRALLVERALYPRFAALLNAAIPTPVLPAWGAYLWVQGVKDRLISDLRCDGNVVCGYEVATSPNEWAGIVQDGLRCGEIAV